MKKLLLFLLIFGLIIGAAFIFFLSRTSPDTAPSDEKVIELSLPPNTQ